VTLLGASKKIATVHFLLPDILKKQNPPLTQFGHKNTTERHSRLQYLFDFNKKLEKRVRYFYRLLKYQDQIQNYNWKKRGQCYFSDYFTV